MILILAFASLANPLFPRFNFQKNPCKAVLIRVYFLPFFISSTVSRLPWACRRNQRLKNFLITDNWITAFLITIVELFTRQFWYTKSIQNSSKVVKNRSLFRFFLWVFNIQKRFWPINPVFFSKLSKKCVKNFKKLWIFLILKLAQVSAICFAGQTNYFAFWFLEVAKFL